jgi:hypothetical protein
MKEENIYTTEKYIHENPTWHVEDSEWKANKILRILQNNNVKINTLAEVGAGAGEILSQLQQKLPKNIEFSGYEISPVAHELCKPRENEKLKFYLGDFFEMDRKDFDVLMCIDVVEHIEDYYGFLKKIKNYGTYKVFHIPLEIAVIMVLRKNIFTNSRNQFGHIHFFTKEIILRSVQDSGYEIVDWFYTPRAIEIPSKSLIRNLAKIPRKILYSIHKDFATRLLGGCSIMILAK